MNNVLENNYMALNKCYPEMTEKIKAYHNINNDIKIQSIMSWDNEIIFRVEKDNKTLYLNGKRNVHKTLDLWYERYDGINKNAVVILLGIGSGTYLKKLVEETEKTVNIVVYEPSVDIFIKLLEDVDIVDVIENRNIIFVVNGINEDDFNYAIDRLITIETLEGVKVDVHPNYGVLFPNDILEKTKKINNRTDFLIVNERTGVMFSSVTARNQIVNTQYVIDGYNTKQLVDVLPYKNRAAILVSAGPSLNKNMKELKKAKNHIFILAVDTAIKPLLKAGIVPDAMITIDGLKPLKLLDIEGANKIPVITSVSSNCEFIANQIGKKILYFDGYMLPQHAYMKVGKVLPHVYVGGSVACTGFSLLYMLGFNTIILVGQDLALTDNRSHADGTFEDSMPEECLEGMIMVKGNFEKEVPTRGDFKVFLDWFDDTIEKMQKMRNTKVINATEGGAFIKGTELKTLKEAIEENFAEYTDYEKCIDQLQSVFSEDEKVTIIKYILSIPDEFTNIKKSIQELILTYKKIKQMVDSGKINSDKYLKLLKKVKKITVKVESNDVYQLITSTLSYAEWIVRSEGPIECDDIEHEADEIVSQGLKFADLMLESANILEECANELVEIVNKKYPSLYSKANS